MRALATWCVRHRRIVALLWVAALVVMTVISQAVGSAYSNNFQPPNTESTQAIALLKAAAPKLAGDTEQIVFQASGGTRVTDPGVEARIE